MDDPSKQGPEATQFKPGKSGNPGGLTADERAARDLMRRELGSPEMFVAWRAGYLAQLIAENPLILKDYADRVGGKPKERVEVTGEEGAPLAALLPEDMVAFAKWRVEQRAKTESLPDAPTAK